MRDWQKSRGSEQFDEGEVETARGLIEKAKAG